MDIARSGVISFPRRMFPVLVPMDASSTLTVEDRTEVRTRTTVANKFADDLETDPVIRFNKTMRHGQDGFSIAYTPRILFADFQSSHSGQSIDDANGTPVGYRGRDGEILNGGTATFEMHRGRTNFAIGTFDQYGTIYANSLVIPQRWKGEGAPPVIYSLPANQSLRLTYLASYTNAVLQRNLTKRLSLTINGQFGAFGGPDEDSRRNLPLVYGPTGEAKLEYAVGKRDDVIVTGGVHYSATKQADTLQVPVATDESKTVAVPQIQPDPAIVGYGELRYRHKWAARATSEIAGGLAVAHQTFPDAYRVDVFAARPNTIPYPTGEFLTVYNHGDPNDTSHNHVQGVFAARINPWFSPFGGLNEERAEFSAAVNFLFKKDVIRVQGSFYHVVPTTDTPGIYSFGLAEIDWEHKLTKTVTLDFGLRALRQYFDERTVEVQATALGANGAPTGTTSRVPPNNYISDIVIYSGFVGLSWQPTPVRF